MIGVVQRATVSEPGASILGDVFSCLAVAMLWPTDQEPKAMRVVPFGGMCIVLNWRAGRPLFSMMRHLHA